MASCTLTPEHVCHHVNVARNLETPYMLFSGMHANMDAEHGTNVHGLQSGR